MKKKNVLALALAAGLVFGGTAYAAGAQNSDLNSAEDPFNHGIGKKLKISYQKKIKQHLRLKQKQTKIL